MYTGTVINELMDTVERTTSRATEYPDAESQELLYLISSPDFGYVETSFSGAM